MTWKNIFASNVNCALFARTLYIIANPNFVYSIYYYVPKELFNNKLNKSKHNFYARKKCLFNSFYLRKKLNNFQGGAQNKTEFAWSRLTFSNKKFDEMKARSQAERPVLTLGHYRLARTRPIQPTFAAPAVFNYFYV